MLAETTYNVPRCFILLVSLGSNDHPEHNAHSPHFTNNKSSGSDPIIGPVSGREMCAEILRLRQDKGIEVQLVEEGVKYWTKSITPNDA